MLVSTSNKEFLIFAEFKCENWFIKFILGDFFFVLPFPDEETTIVEVSKRDKVDWIWRKS
jgi:hypothetical protein